MHLFCQQKFDSPFVQIDNHAHVQIEVFSDESSHSPKKIDGFIQSMSENEKDLYKLNRILYFSSKNVNTKSDSSVFKLEVKNNESFISNSQQIIDEFFIVVFKDFGSDVSEDSKILMPSCYFKNIYPSFKLSSTDGFFNFQSKAILTPLEIESNPLIYKVNQKNKKQLQIIISVLTSQDSSDYPDIKETIKEMNQTSEEVPILFRLNLFNSLPLLKSELKFSVSFEESNLNLKNPLHEQDLESIQYLYFEDSSIFRSVMESSLITFVSESKIELLSSNINLYKHSLEFIKSKQYEKALKHVNSAQGQCFGMEVNGLPGSGKSCFVRNLTISLACPIVEIDFEKLLFPTTSLKFTDFLKKVDNYKSINKYFSLFNGIVKRNNNF